MPKEPTPLEQLTEAALPAMRSELFKYDANARADVLRLVVIGMAATYAPPASPTIDVETAARVAEMLASGG